MKELSGRYLLLLVGILLGLVFLVAFLIPDSKPINTANVEPELSVDVFLNETEIQAEIASTDAKRVLGLGGRAGLKSGAGMLFIFPEPSLHGIWMKDMLIPIDIIWLDGDFNVVHVAENISPDSYPTVFYPSADASYVLEVNAGTVDKSGILAGQKIDISSDLSGL